jgi:hypothetical protein
MNNCRAIVNKRKMKLTYGNSWLLVLGLCLFSNVIDTGNTFTIFFYIENLKYLLLLIPYVIIIVYHKSIARVKIKNYIWLVLLIIIIELIRPSDDTLVKVIRVLALFPLLYLAVGIRVSKKLGQLVLFSFILITLYYSYIQNWFMGGSFRMVFSSTDANVSSMYILFAFFIAQKLKLPKLSLLLIVMGSLTLSRNFLIAIFLYFIFSYFKNYRLFYTTLKSLTLFRIALVSSLLIIIMSFTIFNSHSYNIGSGQGVERFVDVNDESNYSRFKVNRQAITALFLSAENIIYGLGTNYHKKEHLTIAHKVHNGPIDAVVTYGLLFSLLSLFIVSQQTKSTKDNLPYLLSYGFFFSFLPGLLATIYIIIFVIILSIKENNETFHYSPRL